MDDAVHREVHYHRCKRHNNLIRQVDRIFSGENGFVGGFVAVTIEAVIGTKCYCPAYDSSGWIRENIKSCDAVVMRMNNGR